MKSKNINIEEYNKQLDILAQEAMKCTLTAAYSHPTILTILNDAAIANNLTIAQEIADRSYVMATTMLKYRHKFLMKNEGSNTSTKG